MHEGLENARRDTRAGSRGASPPARPTARRLVALLFALALIPTLVAQAAVGDTALVSRASDATGAGGDGDSGPGVAISSGGRFVAFESSADNLSGDDNDAVQDVFLRDMETNLTTLVSRATGAAGAGGDGDSASPAISADGRYVAFESQANNLSDEDNDGVTNVFVRDTLEGTTVLASRAGGVSGMAGDADSRAPSLAGDGSAVSFDSAAENLSDEDSPGTRDVFVRNLQAGDTVLASRASGALGVAGDADSYDSSLSANGRRISFTSEADNLSPDDVNTVTNVFAYDTTSKFTILASRANGRLSVGADADSRESSISPDGRCVSFTSDAENLGGADPPTPTFTDIFVRDIQANTITLASRASGTSGAPGDGSSFDSTVSQPAGSDPGTIPCDQRSVAFLSAADNLSNEDVATFDVFVRDMFQAMTVLLSRATGEPGAAATGSTFGSSLSPDGAFVAFASEADNLSGEDNDIVKNVYMRPVATGPPPPPPPPPDLGGNTHDHGSAAHVGGSAVHAPGHPPSAHHPSSSTARGLRLSGGTLFAAARQDIDRLVVMAFIHERGTIVVDGRIRTPGRLAKVHRFKPVRRKSSPHVPNRVRLRLRPSALRSVKRALRRGKRLRAKVRVRTIGEATGRRTTASTSIRLKP